jgi:hypothetical protein
VSLAGAIAAFLLAWGFRRVLERHVRHGTEPAVYAPGWDPIPGPVPGSFDDFDSK